MPNWLHKYISFRIRFTVVAFMVCLVLSLAMLGNNSDAQQAQNERELEEFNIEADEFVKEYNEGVRETVQKYAEKEVRFCPEDY